MPGSVRPGDDTLGVVARPHPSLATTSTSLSFMPLLTRQGDHRAQSGPTRGLLDIGSVIRQSIYEPQPFVHLATLPSRHFASRAKD